MTRGTLISYALAGAMVLFGLYGQLIIKYRSTLHVASMKSGGMVEFLGTMLLDPWVLSSFVSAFAGALCWLLAIRNLPLSVLYPALASSFILVPLGAATFLGERLAVHQILGCAVVFGGIVLATWPS